jgi:hypothetical protein
MTFFKRFREIAVCGLVFCSCAFVAGAADNAESKCSALLRNAPANTKLESATVIPAGSFAPPYGRPVDKLPEFCRVHGVITPTTDSYIRFEVWLPTSGWNGKYLGVGNGGFAGAIDFRGMGGNIRRGYATAATDTGHEGESEDASWAYKHPEKVADFGYRGLHLTTEVAKTLLAAYYGAKAKHSYFDSCSDGGREALMEAQRFPQDFDGILAGAPANSWTHMFAAVVQVAQLTYGNPASYIPANKLPAITAAVRAACDAQDGVKDGIINDPNRCRFDPEVLRCKGVPTRTCLTDPQIASLRVFYRGAVLNGKPFFPGLAPGGEDGTNGWNTWISGSGPGGGSMNSYVSNFFRYVVYDEPHWNILTASFEDSLKAAESKAAKAVDSVNPDLGPFASRGGKLILYHGWNDPAISPWNSINYLQSVTAKLGESKTNRSVRLYMVPGMQHCIGGNGPSSFGQLGTTTAEGSSHGIYAALETWVEKDTPPGTVVATKYAADDPSKVVMTRPICAYPQVAKYKGAGSTDDAANFACADPASGEGTPERVP